MRDGLVWKPGRGRKSKKTSCFLRRRSDKRNHDLVLHAGAVVVSWAVELEAGNESRSARDHGSANWNNLIAVGFAVRQEISCSESLARITANRAPESLSLSEPGRDQI